MSRDARRLFAEALDLVLPPERLSPSEWTAANRVMGSKSPRPGVWDWERTPYMRQVYDAYVDPKVERLVMMCGSQVGKTEMLVNLLGWTVHQKPGVILWVHPTERLAKKAMHKTSPLAATGVLRGLFPDMRTPQRGQSVSEVQFPGGDLYTGWSNSAATLAGDTCSVVLADEVDRFADSAGEEGDPVMLAIQRTQNFKDRKIVMVSTPVLAGTSRIEAEFNESDQRFWETPCAGCHEPFVFQWEHVNWKPNEPETARMVCPACGYIHTEEERLEVMRQGEWIVTGKGKTRGYSIWTGQTEWVTLPELAEAFLAADDNPLRQRVFWNTKLGRPWAPEGMDISAEALVERMQEWDTAPSSALFFTMAVDVQDDRLECYISGWSENQEHYGIRYEVVRGDPQYGGTWARVGELLAAPITLASGRQVRIHACGVDSGGHRTQAVYRWVQWQQANNKSQRVLALKGSSNPDAKISERTTAAHRVKKTGEIRPSILHVGTHEAKTIIMARAGIKDGDPGASLNFGSQISKRFVEGIASERLIAEPGRDGRLKHKWRQVSSYNEPLDLLVYSLALLHWATPPWRQMARTAARADAKAMGMETKGIKAKRAPATPREHAPLPKTKKRRRPLRVSYG